MTELNKHGLGMTVGSFAALVHLVWLIFVAMGIARPLIDWCLSLHFMSMSYSMTPFAFGNAIMLLIVTFIGGYIGGWVFAAMWNQFYRK